ncbi:hypothetical protein BAZOLSSOX_2302 [uncultured Gammaproteobacteria bacterium]|nr:hypothetical protein BAZOLSSOX_2302 [uncultured Gammaproteobacteria bacterium]
MGWFFRILIGIFWVGWFYFWIWVFFKLKCCTYRLNSPQHLFNKNASF